MPVFSYTAMGPDGRRQTGELEAADRRQVARELTAQQIRPINIVQRNKPVREEGTESFDYYSAIQKGDRGTSKRTISKAFLTKLLDLLNSGLQAGDAVQLLSARTTDPAQKKLANQMWKSLSEGQSLANAMRSCKGTFNESTISLVEAGEATGGLGPILEKQVAYMEEVEGLRKQIISSITYPATVISVAFLVLLLFLFFLLPRIRDILDSLGGEINILARILLAVSDFATSWMGISLFVGLIGLVIFLVQWRRTSTGRKVLDDFALKVPMLNRILLYNAVFQTSSLVSTLLSSGINTPEALGLAEKTVGNTHLKSKVMTSRTMIREGESLSGAMRKTHLYPDIAVDIMTVGENTGNVVQSLNEINRMYRAELSKSLTRLTSLISAGTLILAIGFVAIIAFAILMSVISVPQAIQGI